jgi:hypothetical protein
MIGDGLTQGMKVISHALHLMMIVVADIEVALLKDMELGIELQNTGLAVVEDLDVERDIE